MRFLKQLNLPIETLVAKNSLSEFCSKPLLLAARTALLQKSAKPTNDNSPPIYRWAG
jgi:hypothetical protein